MQTATMIVPPVYEAQLFGQGYDAVQISARKVKLVKMGAKNCPSVSYNKFDAVEQMSFAELVNFVILKSKK
jgi:hypothetical protein